jgi:ABC-type antimicrobial peptide transport system permease subunit
MILRWQVAVAAGFFIVATMFIRATVEQARHDSGIDQDRLAVATLSFQPASLDAARAQRAVERVVSEAAQHPSVESVAASTGLPFGVPALQVNATALGGQANAARASAIAATPSIFRVLGVPILHGRSFTDLDGVAAARVAVISELTAKQLFATADPLGRAIVLTIAGRQTTATIIGISRDTDVGRLNGPRHQLIYLPLAQHFDRNITVTARASGRVATTVAALRTVVPAADPAARVDIAGPARSVLWGPYAIVGAAGRGALYLGAFTLLLSMVGLFGVQSQVVVYRTREFGVRMSLGASTRQIQAMVIRDGARPVFDGLVLGLWGGIAGRVLVRSYMDVEVTVLDPWMLIIAPIPIVLAALCACYLPATRAARVDPMTALRCE